jgi:membrane associated rhomboid family serine protease
VETGMRMNDWLTYRIFILLLLFGLVSVIFLWTLNPVSSQSQTTFAIYLSIDLVVFAMVSYVFRVSKWGEEVKRLPLVAGCVVLLILLYVGLTI